MTSTPETTLGNIQTSVFCSSNNSSYQATKWFFTYHIKYENDSFEQQFEKLNELKVLCDKYVWSEEYGSNGETPHIQGAFILKRRTKLRASTIQNKFFTNGVSLMKLKNWGCAYEYCIKESNRIITNVEKPDELKVINNLRTWQINLINIIKNEPDDRDIYWIVGKQGMGKTQFIKYLVSKYNAIILSGSPSNMKNGIIEFMKNNNGNTPRLICSNIGFDKDLCTVSYSGYEDIKDMCFYSGKYEGGMVCGNNPHLFIFANGKSETENEKFINIEI